MAQAGKVVNVPYKLARLCRVCNLESMDCLPLFKPHVVSQEVTTLATVLSFCANIDVLEDDLFLPAQMCQKCVMDLSQYYEFKRMALCTDHTLRKLYANLCKQSRVENSSALHSPSEEQEEEASVDTAATNQISDSGQENSDGNYYYVLGESMDAVECIMDEDTDMSAERIIEESSENDIHFEDAEQSVEVIEVIDQEIEYGSDKAMDNDEDLEPEDEYTVAKAGKSILLIKPRTPRQKRSHNPALQCQICDKQLSTSNSYKYHMQLHSDEKPFVCTTCGESFKTRNAFEGHITVHNPNNPNKCEDCGKTYRQASSLRSHMLTHTGEKPFSCHICGKGLTQKSGYKKHMLTHTGEKPHNCEICGRTFRYSSNLIAHRRSHTQEKPYQCNICPKKAFGSNSELNRHNLVHSNDKPFLCNKCGKTFKRHVQFVMHQRTHEEEILDEIKQIPKDEEESTVPLLPTP